MSNKVRARFAPSPTGFVHIGSLRTALYNYLFAKKNGGEYILRIEDTDQTRFVEGAIEDMIAAFEWAGIHNDEGVVVENGQTIQKGDFGPYIQSERLEIYKKYVDQLLENDYAYYCFCTRDRLDKVKEEQMAKGDTPRYDGHCRSISLEEARKRAAAGEPHVIRLKFPENTDINFEDIVRGSITMNTRDLDDQVLMKTDGFPTYHFAVVIDDHLMGITHVIRGEEWVSSTPKHVFLYQAYGWEAPKFVHLPNILGKSGKKLSKRNDSVAVSDFKAKGYLPQGLLNYLSLVGWSPEGEQEIFSMEELIEAFSLERISKAGGIFDVDKLNHINSHYMKTEDLDVLTEVAIPHLMEAGYITEADAKERRDWIKDVVTLLKDRLSHMEEIKTEAGIFFKSEYQMVDENAKEIMKVTHMPQLLDIFEAKVKAAQTIDNDFGKNTFKEIQAETGYKGKDLFMPLRVALTGEVHGPDMGLAMKVLGKERLLARVAFARTLL